MFRKLTKNLLQAWHSVALKTRVLSLPNDVALEEELITVIMPCEEFSFGDKFPLGFNEEADSLIQACADLKIPRDGSTLVRVEKMPPWLRRLALKVAIKEDPFYSVSEMMFEEPHHDFRYVIGYSSPNTFFDHAWLKLGDAYYDPAGELHGDRIKGRLYLPLFELDLAALNEEMSERNSPYAPTLEDLIEWSNRRRQHRLEAQNQSAPSGESS